MSSSSSVFRIGNLRENKIKESTVIQKLKEAANDPESSVNELYFWKIDFTQKIVNELWTFLANDCRIWENIKFMQCTGHVEAAINTVFHYENVKSFVLSGVDTTPNSLQAVSRGLEHNESIQTVRLLGVHFAEGTTTKAFEGLTQTKSLLELDLTRSHLAHGAVPQLSSALGENCSLQTIKLEQCNLTDEEMAEIVDSIYDHPTVRHLDLTQNCAHSHALESIADLLVSDECSLKSLNLSSQNSSQENEELDGWTHLAKAIDALQNNTSLTELDVSGNKYSNPAVLKAFSRCLSQNTTLQTLDINDSEISEEGIKILGRSLPSFRGLKVLNITGSEYGEEALQCLADGLRHNRILQNIGSIVDGKFGSLSHRSNATIIEHYLDLNRAGRRAMQNDIPLSLWPVLLARAGAMDMDMDGDDEDKEGATAGRNENVLFSLLRGPALFER